MAVLVLYAAAAVSFGFSVHPKQVSCFEEHAAVSGHVLGSWKLAALGPDAAQAGWKVDVKSPSGDNVYTSEGEQEGSFDYYGTEEGIYVVCFHNTQTYAVDVSAKIKVGEPPDLIQLAKTEHLTPIEERIKNVSARTPGAHTFGAYGANHAFFHVHVRPSTKLICHELALAATRVDELRARSSGPDPRAGRGAIQDDEEYAFVVVVSYAR